MISPKVTLSSLLISFNTSRSLILTKFLTLRRILFFFSSINAIAASISSSIFKFSRVEALISSLWISASTFLLSSTNTPKSLISLIFPLTISPTLWFLAYSWTGDSLSSLMLKEIFWSSLSILIILTLIISPLLNYLYIFHFCPKMHLHYAKDPLQNQFLQKHRSRWSNFSFYHITNFVIFHKFVKRFRK